MAGFKKFIFDLLEFAFKGPAKVCIAILNLIPLKVYELHGLQGTGPNNRPDLRAFKINIKDRRRAHLGMFIVAWTRGVVFRTDLNSSGAKCWGIYSEDFQDIQKKWIL